MKALLQKITFCILALACLFSAVQARPQSAVLRLHILANSDAAEDQRVKLAVRDALLCALPARALTRAEAAALIKSEAETLASTVDAVLAENGCGYGARFALGAYAFPERFYGARRYPAGDYLALRVVLGAGGGQNWWCVLFPPLCIVEGPDGEIEYTEEGKIRWKSLLREWYEAKEAQKDAQTE